MTQVTVPVTHRLIDRSLEIPPFLLRNPDGSLTYPECPVPQIHEAIEFSTIPEEEQKLTPADRITIAEILAQEAIGSVVDEQFNRQKRADQKAERDARKEQLRQNKMKARQVFMKHFKWDWEQ
jgi:hypothetical protein